MSEFPFEEVEVSEAEAEKIFAKGNRRAGKVWNKEKFIEMTKEEKIYHWTIDQFVKEFALDPSKFTDEKDMRKSIRRFLRRAMKGRGKYELSEDSIVVYRKTEE